MTRAEAAVLLERSKQNASAPGYAQYREALDVAIAALRNELVGCEIGYTAVADDKLELMKAKLRVFEADRAHMKYAGGVPWNGPESHCPDAFKKMCNQDECVECSESGNNAEWIEVGEAWAALRALEAEVPA